MHIALENERLPDPRGNMIKEFIVTKVLESLLALSKTKWSWQC